MHERAQTRRRTAGSQGDARGFYTLVPCWAGNSDLSASGETWLRQERLNRDVCWFKIVTRPRLCVKIGQAVKFEFENNLTLWVVRRPYRVKLHLRAPGVSPASGIRGVSRGLLPVLFLPSAGQEFMTEVASDVGSAMDEVLAQFATGQLSCAQHALVASHLALSSRNRAFVRLLEETASGQLDVGAVASGNSSAADLEAIFAAPSRKPQPVVASSDIPAPLRHLMAMPDGREIDSLAWRRYLPGIRRVKVDGQHGGGEANFYWIKAGRKLPSHTHAGREMTLVLRGGFSDAGGHFARGDIALADSNVDHIPVADADEDCLCFAVTEAPLKLTGPFGRIVQRLFGSNA